MTITTLERQELVTEARKNALTYADYRILVAKHAQSFTSTGHTQTEALSNYTVLNDRRMKRWDKTLKFTPAQEDELKNYTRPVNWLVLTESWCGDAPAAVAVMHKMAELQPAINFKLVLRDDHPQLMDAFLTNGGKAIPKLIVQNPENNAVVTSWGSRSKAAQQLVTDFKAENETITPEFINALQKWYNDNKGQAVVEELLAILKEFNLETQN